MVQVVTGQMQAPVVIPPKPKTTIPDWKWRKITGEDKPEPAPPVVGQSPEDKKLQAYQRFYEMTPEAGRKRLPSPTAYSLHLQGMTPDEYRKYESISFAGRTFRPGDDPYSSLVQHGESVNRKLQQAAPFFSFVTYRRTGKHPFEIPGQVSFFGRKAEREYIDLSYATSMRRVSEADFGKLLSGRMEKKFQQLPHHKKAEYNLQFLDWESIPLHERRYYPGWAEKVEMMSPEEKQALQSEVISTLRSKNEYYGLPVSTVEKRLEPNKAGLEYWYGLHLKRNDSDTRILPELLEVATLTPEDYKLKTFEGLSEQRKYGEGVSSTLFSWASFPVTLPQMGMKYVTGKGDAWDVFGRVGTGKTVLLPDLGAKIEQERIGVSDAFSLWMEEGMYKFGGGVGMSPGMQMAKKYPGQMFASTLAVLPGLAFGGGFQKTLTKGVKTGVRYGVASVPKIWGRTQFMFGRFSLFKGPQTTVTTKWVSTTEMVHKSGSLVKKGVTKVGGTTEQGAFIKPQLPPPDITISFPKGAELVSREVTTRPGAVFSFARTVSQSRVWQNLYGYSTGKLKFVKVFKQRGQPLFLGDSATGVKVGQQTYYGSIRKFSGFGKRKLVPAAEAEQFTLGTVTDYSFMVRKGSRFIQREESYFSRTITQKGRLWKRLKAETGTVNESFRRSIIVSGDLGPPSIFRQGSFVRKNISAADQPIIGVIKKVKTTGKKSTYLWRDTGASASLMSPVSVSSYAGQFSQGLGSHGVFSGGISIATSELGSSFLPVLKGGSFITKYKSGERQEPVVYQRSAVAMEPKQIDWSISIPVEKQERREIVDVISRRRPKTDSRSGSIDDEIRIPVSGSSQKQMRLQGQRMALMLESRQLKLQLTSPGRAGRTPFSGSFKFRPIPPPPGDEGIVSSSRLKLTLGKGMFSLRKKGRGEKTILADPFSVMESQIRFGRATHRTPTKDVWREAERSGWRLGTVELMKEGTRGSPKKKKRERKKKRK